jgi:hypothetical protein
MRAGANHLLRLHQAAGIDPFGELAWLLRLSLGE